MVWYHAPGPRRWFTWTPAELAAFTRSTRLVADFNAAVGDENYRIFALTPPETDVPPPEHP